MNKKDDNISFKDQGGESSTVDHLAQDRWTIVNSPMTKETKSGGKDGNITRVPEIVPGSPPRQRNFDDLDMKEDARKENLSKSSNNEWNLGDPSIKKNYKKNGKVIQGPEIIPVSPRPEIPRIELVIEKENDKKTLQEKWKSSGPEILTDFGRNESVSVEDYDLEEHTMDKLRGIDNSLLQSTTLPNDRNQQSISTQRINDDNNNNDVTGNNSETRNTSNSFGAPVIANPVDENEIINEINQRVNEELARQQAVAIVVEPINEKIIRPQLNPICKRKLVWLLIGIIVTVVTSIAVLDPFNLWGNKDNSTNSTTTISAMPPNIIPFSPSAVPSAVPTATITNSPSKSNQPSTSPSKSITPTLVPSKSITPTLVPSKQPSETNWFQIGQDIDGEAANDKSGHSVSLSADGKVVAIGAIGNDDNGSQSGHVRVYSFQSGSWSKLGEDIDGEASEDRSGQSVSLSANGMIVAIGSDQNDANGSNSGHVRVYSFTNNKWSKLGQDIVGEASGDSSGQSTSLSADGTVVAIGAAQNDGNGLSSGHVRVYSFQNNVWSKVGKDIDGENSFDFSGKSVSLSSDGTRIAIGARGSDENGECSGHVRVFTLKNNSWSQLGDDIDGESYQDLSGNSGTVSLSANGKVVAIGAQLNNGNGGFFGTDSGHVRVYSFENDSWIKLGEDINGENRLDNSGIVSISADGTVIAIGAGANDGNGPSSGHVRVFSFVNDNWLQIGSDIDGEGDSDFSGTSVSLSADGKIVAIGAYNNNGINGTDSGHVRIYSFGYSNFQ